MLTQMIFKHGTEKFMVTLGDPPKWFALLWGWWPDGGDIPSYRWMPSEHIPNIVIKDFEKWIGHK
jgi:hypothetical protein